MSFAFWIKKNPTKRTQSCPSLCLTMVFVLGLSLLSMFFPPVHIIAVAGFPFAIFLHKIFTNDKMNHKIELFRTGQTIGGVRELPMTVVIKI